MTHPVNVGDEFDVTIEAIGEKGDGLAKKDGFVIFIPDVRQDQKVRIRVTKVLRKVGFGEVVGSVSQDARVDHGALEESKGQKKQSPSYDDVASEAAALAGDDLEDADAMLEPTDEDFPLEEEGDEFDDAGDERDRGNF